MPPALHHCRSLALTRKRSILPPFGKSAPATIGLNRKKENTDKEESVKSYISLCIIANTRYCVKRFYLTLSNFMRYDYKFDRLHLSRHLEYLLLLLLTTHKHRCDYKQYDN